MNRIREALHWLAAEFSVTRDEFRAAHKAGSDMLLDGLLSHGYARERDGRFALTDAGRRAMGKVEP
jgi:hypothetical protein